MARLVKTGRVAAQFGVSTFTVRRWIEMGRLPAVRSPGGNWLVDAETVAQLLAPLAKADTEGESHD